MMTISKLSKLTGVSVRTLQYYDRIGLLAPAQYTKAGYRMYDHEAMERLQQILLFKELKFTLKEISHIIDAPDFDRAKALEKQIELLEMKKEYLEGLITFAKNIQRKGVKEMDFTVFDKTKMEEYKERAKDQWGETAEYREYKEKLKGRSPETQKLLLQNLMNIFVDFGSMKEKNPDDPSVQLQVKKLQSYITENFYTCTKETLSGLGKMYAAGGEFTANINKAAGAGTATFVGKAIEIYCK